MKKVIALIWVTCLSVTFSGCVRNGDLEAFPEKPFQSGKISKVRLVTDCFVLNETSYKLNVDKNLDVCTRLAGKVSQLLEDELGVEVTPTIISSGLQAGPYKKIESTKEEQSIVKLPVYEGAISVSDKEQFLLSSISEKLSSVTLSWEQREQFVMSLKGVYFPQVKEMNLAKDEVMVLVQANGLDVDESVADREAAVVGILSFGSMMMYRLPSISAQAIILNSEGTPIWADALFRARIASDCEVNHVSTSFMKYFPSNVKQGSPAYREEPTPCTSAETLRAHR
ncbi:hypothetical protein [uncultured Shewanella sp.]|uniref:hypothetical protein n=1 Tax=uncultured Shewanella sp. TaxID=173975 RepID=UPI0026101370|nr:hypothetical protein [uncultured Shewanella sp.]